MFEELAARCRTQGWELRACAEGYELLGNGAPAAWRRLETCAEWVTRWAGAERQAADPLDEDAAPPAAPAPIEAALPAAAEQGDQLSFLMAA